MNTLGRAETLAIAALLAATAVQLGYGLASDGLTNDEILYISDGCRQAWLGDYRLNPTHPPLGKRLAALGLLGLHLRIPELRLGDDVLAWSYRFVHVENDARTLVIRARVPAALLTLALAALLWSWARSVGGAAAGVAALGLLAFHPSILAHGHLATTDLPATFAMLFASWAFWRWSLAPTLGRAALFGLAFGLGVATRLTAWLLLPCFVLLTAFEARRMGHRGRRGRNLVVLTAVCLALVPLVVWASYGFHYAPWPGESVAERVRDRIGPPGQLIGAFQSLRLLPEAYLESARYQLEHNLSGHPAYLLGRHSKTGWPHYYLVAFLVKNTPGFLLGIAGLALFLWRKRKAMGQVVAHWLVPPAAMFLAVSAGGIQIGERYLLPLYPYLILLLAMMAAFLWESRRGRAMLAALFLLHAGPTLAAAPRGALTYFNVLAGGAQGGHRVLLDSNLDWGQDLPRLAAWMRLRRVSTIQLAYHGVDDPDRYGIDHEDLPGWHLYPAHPSAEPLRGTVAVSPNLLFGLMPRLGDPYGALRGRPPDDRAGVFFIYRMERELSDPRH